MNAAAVDYESIVDGKFVAGNSKLSADITKGADKSVFNNWTYLSTKNKLQ
ncbi:MAG: hypothetical protein IPN29_15815 [Saprospiraceae bacterium]|nr:hypothetical protein [Saprospiraceae bacterium]